MKKGKLLAAVAALLGVCVLLTLVLTLWQKSAGNISAGGYGTDGHQPCLRLPEQPVERLRGRGHPPL